MSLSACGPDEAKSGDKPDSSASAAKDQDHGSSGQEGTGGSAGGKENGSAGTGDNGEGSEGGEGGTADNSRPVALPLPKGAGPTSAVAEGKTLELTFMPDGGSAEDAANAYEQQLQTKGYESPDGTWTRGKQTLDVAADADSFRVTLTYPGQAPPLPAAPLQHVSSDEDDTLKLTYGPDPGSADSKSMVKSYFADLADKGWDVPTDGGTAATKGNATIELGITDDPDLVALTVDVPASAA